MKPVLQLYGIVADQLGIRTKEEYEDLYAGLLEQVADEEKAKDKFDALREKDVKKYLFDQHLEKIENTRLELQKHQHPEFFENLPEKKTKSKSQAKTKKEVLKDEFNNNPLLPADKVLSNLEENIRKGAEIIKAIKTKNSAAKEGDEPPKKPRARKTAVKVESCTTVDTKPEDIVVKSASKKKGPKPITIKVDA
jgi:hypothetical protein